MRLGAAAALSVLSACAPSGTGGGELADVVLISLDTLRADRLSCYGHERETTPFLDSFAARGVRVAQAFSPSSQTAPSHVSLFSGLHPFAHGINNVSAGSTECFRLSPQHPTLTEALADGGYQTAIFSDGGNVLPGMGFDRGFDSLRFSLGDPRATLEAVRAWSGGLDPDLPAFLFFHTYTTHSPYLPAAGFRGRYTDPAYEGEFLRRVRELEGRSRLETFSVAARFLDPFDGMGEADIAFLSDLYDETVAYADALTERLLGVWSEARDPERTLTIVLSDHGEEFFEHGSLGHKRMLFRELVHVPFLATGPGLSPRVVEAPLDLTGLFSTVVEFVGLEPSPSASPSFLDALRGESGPPGPPHQQLVLGPVAGQWRATVSDGARYLRYESEEQLQVDLFDLEDRAEAISLEGDPRTAGLEALSVQRADADFLILRGAFPAQVPLSGGSGQKILEALGYTDPVQDR